MARIGRPASPGAGHRVPPAPSAASHQTRRFRFLGQSGPFPDAGATFSRRPARRRPVGRPGGGHRAAVHLHPETGAATKRTPGTRARSRRRSRRGLQRASARQFGAGCSRADLNGSTNLSRRLAGPHRGAPTPQMTSPSPPPLARRTSFDTATLRQYIPTPGLPWRNCRNHHEENRNASCLVRTKWRRHRVAGW